MEKATFNSGDQTWGGGGGIRVTDFFFYKQIVIDSTRYHDSCTDHFLDDRFDDAAYSSPKTCSSTILCSDAPSSPLLSNNNKKHMNRQIKINVTLD